MIERIDKILTRILIFFVSLQGLALVVLIGLEVVFRYVVGHALSWPEEVVGLIFVWFTLIGVVLLTRSGEHIEFSFLMTRFGSLVGKVLGTFIQALIAVFALLMIVYGYSYATMFRFETTPAVGINTLWMNISFPLCGILVFFYAVLNMVRIFLTPHKHRNAP